MTGIVPSAVNAAKTIVEGSKDPKDYRPITIVSHLARSFHRVLASKMTSSLELNPRQRAFIPVDGCAENTFILGAVIKEAQQRVKPLHSAFLDVSKAFDTVLNLSVLRALERLGVPPPLLKYIEAVYSSATTTIEVGGFNSAVIKCTTGTRQGDPLSGFLFNCVVDECLAKLDPHVGFELNGTRIGYMAFADDIVLVGSTETGLQRSMNTLAKALKETGLFLNPRKCATFTIAAHPKAKKWVVDCRKVFTVNENAIRALSVVEVYKHIELDVGVRGIRKTDKGGLDKILFELRQAVYETIPKNVDSAEQFTALILAHSGAWRNNGWGIGRF